MCSKTAKSQIWPVKLKNKTFDQIWPMKLPPGNPVPESVSLKIPGAGLKT